MEFVTLPNGVRMPAIGYGSYHLFPWKTRKPLAFALEAGYRLIDTANIYLNERTIRRTLKNLPYRREDLFIVSKIWPTYFRDEDCVERTLKRLGIDYIDVLLLHHPSGDFLAGYRKLEQAYEKGLVRAIGLSNFFGEKLEAVLSQAKVKPHIVQLEAHPYCSEKAVLERLSPYGTKMMAYYPLGHAENGLFQEKILQDIARAHGKSVAQVILRWHVQKGFIPIPGSDDPDHLRSNMEVFDFRLSDEEMARIAALDTDRRFYVPTPKKEAHYVRQIPFLWK